MGGSAGRLPRCRALHTHASHMPAARCHVWCWAFTAAALRPLLCGRAVVDVRTRQPRCGAPSSRLLAGPRQQPRLPVDRPPRRGGQQLCALQLCGAANGEWPAHQVRPHMRMVPRRQGDTWRARCAPQRDRRPACVASFKPRTLCLLRHQPTNHQRASACEKHHLTSVLPPAAAAGGCWTWGPSTSSSATTTRCATTAPPTSCAAGCCRWVLQLGAAGGCCSWVLQVRRLARLPCKAGACCYSAWSQELGR